MPTSREGWLRCAEEYLRLEDEAFRMGRRAPSETWLLVLESAGVDPTKVPPAPPAGYLRCPICGRSRPWAHRPSGRTETCTEWDLHPSLECETFDVAPSWEPWTPPEEQSDPASPGDMKVSLEDVMEASARASSSRKKAKSRAPAPRKAPVKAKTKGPQGRLF